MSQYKLHHTHFFQQIIYNFHPLYSNENICIPYINKSLHNRLNMIKSYIDYIVNEWEKYKKYTNPYEFIHTIIPEYKYSICKLKPLSRSFYKMIELMNSMNLINELPEVCKSFHLAEGPGGFIEALEYMRKNDKDKYYGITLINQENTNVPGWKKSKHYLNKHKNVFIEEGYDKTGDITNHLNYLHMYTKHSSSCDIITADGGFDYSSNFNEQEIISSKLIFCEIAFAIMLQKQNGNFILKMFDIFSPFSVDCLYLLSLIYENVYITKPQTSRLANSEKYIVCKNFSINKQTQYALFNICFHIMQDCSKYKYMTRILNCDIPYIFIESLENINTKLVKQQVDNIIETLTLIEKNIKGNKDRTEKLEKLKNTNIEKCITWCQEHNLPYTHYNINKSNIFLQK